MIQKPIWQWSLFGVLSIGSSLAYAVSPPMPGNTNGDGNPAHNGMKHVMVRQTGSVLSVHVDDPPPTPVTMMSGFGVDYTPDKFNVLENVFFNAQHGWLPDGFFNLPTGTSIWIERTGISHPSGAQFRVYEGGNMSQGMASWTMNEIHNMDGYRWQWDGLMQHDYFTADLLGQYTMSFRVYVGDSQGVPVAGFEPAATTLSFQVIPEPVMGSWILLAGIGLARSLRRRLAA